MSEAAPRVFGAALLTMLCLATPARAQERSGVLGPAGDETLRSWTDRWLEGPVQLIATDEEKELYGELETVAARLQFIRLFWERRDPTPRDDDNEFLREFRRRIAWVEENHGNGEPGWQTAFGHVALIVGIPDRTLQTSEGMAGLSERPLVVWSYDRRIPEWPVMENFIFAYRSRHWRLQPHSETRLRGSARQAQTDWEMRTALEIVPDDFLRLQRAMVRETTLQPPRYTLIDRVSAAVAFPEAEIPFAWQTRFAAGEGGETRIEVVIGLRLAALFFHAENDLYRARMTVHATLSRDDEPLVSRAEPLTVEVPHAELAGRADDVVERTLVLTAPPGIYDLELVLEEPSLGYRTVYRADLDVPPSDPVQALRWIGADGDPIVFASEEEALEFLDTAEVVSTETLATGVTAARKLLLHRNGVRAHAVFRDIDRTDARVRLDDGSFHPRLRDRALFEVAAYRLARLLGLANVPPTVARRIDGRAGSLQLWIEGAVPGGEVAAGGRQPGDYQSWSADTRALELFDLIIGNVDRNSGNFLLGPNGRMWFIDHTRSFQTFVRNWSADAIVVIDRVPWQRLQRLDRAALEAALGDLLSPLEIEQLVERVDAVVEHVREQIAARGENAVVLGDGAGRTHR